jgi:hypothetical protein
VCFIIIIHHFPYSKTKPTKIIGKFSFFLIRHETFLIGIKYIVLQYCITILNSHWENQCVMSNLVSIFAQGIILIFFLFGFFSSNITTIMFSVTTTTTTLVTPLDPTQKKIVPLTSQTIATTQGSNALITTVATTPIGLDPIEATTTTTTSSSPSPPRSLAPPSEGGSKSTAPLALTKPSTLSTAPIKGSTCIRTREQLISALSVAAEIENAIQVVVLFSAFSLKKNTNEGLTTFQLRLVRKWERQLLRIAHQQL